MIIWARRVPATLLAITVSTPVRGTYAELGPLLITVAVLGLVVPLAVILWLGLRVDVGRTDSRPCETSRIRDSP